MTAKYVCTGILLLLMQTGFAAPSLVDAARYGEFERVQELLDDNVDINMVHPDGTTTLIWATYHDKTDLVDRLISAGANVNAASDYGVTPLVLACENGNTAMVKRLLLAGADPDHAKVTGKTPLMVCSNRGDAEAVKELLARGANPDATENKQGQTALMWAAAEKHAEVVRVLIENGADVNIDSKAVPEPEPFIISIPSNDELNIECCSIFLSNYPKSVRFPKISGGFSALHFAARQGDVEISRMLLQAGADINDMHQDYGTPLTIAIASGHQDLARFLLQNGADPNRKDGWGIAPLHYALHKGVLLLNNFKPSVTDQFGWERNNMPKLVKALLDHGADPDPRIEHSFPFTDNPFFARAVEDPPQVDPTGATPLLLAAVSGDIDSMRILLDAGADKNLTTVGGATLLMLAAGVGVERSGRIGPEQQSRNQQEAIEATRFALAIGSDVNAHLTEVAPMGPGMGKEDGRTAMHAAVYLQWTDMIRFLAENGADLNVKDRYGMTPMMIALEDPEARYYRNLGEGNSDSRYREPPPQVPEVIDMLLTSGADPFTGVRVGGSRD